MTRLASRVQVNSSFAGRFRKAFLTGLLLCSVTPPASAQGLGNFGKLFQGNPALSSLTKSGAGQPSAIAQAAGNVTGGSTPSAFKYPINKTDFVFQGQPSQQKNCGALTQDAAAARQLTDVCLAAYQEVLKLPIFRKNNLSDALTLLIVASLQVKTDQEFSDEESVALERSINDLLVNSGIMTKMKSADIQALYELSIMFSGLVIGIYQNGKETNDQEVIDSAKSMAQGFLEVFGFGKE